MTPPDVQPGPGSPVETAAQGAAPTLSSPGPAQGGSPGVQAQARKTLLFANDKSSGKTTTANAVLVNLLERYPHLMRSVIVREYDRQPRLSNIFRAGDGLAAVEHHDARNANAFDAQRELAYDPNATVWDDLLYRIGAGGLVVDLGANIFADICRILDDEPRPVFPDGGACVGVVVPVTTASDSVESAIAAAEAAIGWGPATRVFLVEQEYLGRFGETTPDWIRFRERMSREEASRVRVIRIERLPIADIGRVVFQRIDRMVATAQETLRSSNLQGAEYIRAIRAARTEVAWGAQTLEAVSPIADWFAR